MALMSDIKWSARWIADPERKPTTLQPAALFRRTFVVPEGVTFRAVLRFTALGCAKALLNGREVTDELFLPGWTDYYERVQFRAYEVSGLLKSGKNLLEIFLADGWYAGTICDQLYGHTPALSAELHVTTPGGKSLLRLLSDAEWECADDGPVRMSDIYMGEDYDAGLAYRSFRQAEVVGRDVRIEAFDGVPVRRIERLDPIGRNGRIFDFGQNLTGREVLVIRNAVPGCKVVIRHAEVLDANGALYTVNLRAARAESHYTCRGGGEERYEPCFTFYGFRYLEVIGIDDFDVFAWVIHSDMAVTGDFECSNLLVNQLFRNIMWGQRDNFLDVPTDCPQRDERRGWLGDAQVFIRAACYNMDVLSFFRRWLRDVASSRSPEGAYPVYAPYHGAKNAVSGEAGWADAGIICPWQLYLFYGDKALLEEHYAAMTGYLEYQRRRAPEGIFAQATFGDWLNHNAHTPEELIGTAFYANNAHILSRVAAVLGKSTDAQNFRALAVMIRMAFYRRFHAQLTTQTAAALALQFDLVPTEARAGIVRELVYDITVRRGNHLSTGFLGTPLLLNALSENGEHETACRLLEQTDCPSWLYPVIHGATTVWERWDSWTREKGMADPVMNSFNHYAYGAVADWLYGVLGGIKPLEEFPGFRRFTIDPRPGGSFTAVGVRYRDIRVSWQKFPGYMEYHITVPEGCEACFRSELLRPGVYYRKELIS